MPRQIITTPNAPKAIGTYSQAVKCGSTVYVSGQIPLDPASGELVAGPIEAQISRVFDNLKAVITASGNYASVNKVMAEYIKEPYPARAAIGVAALPRNAPVEMDCVVELD